MLRNLDQGRGERGKKFTEREGVLLSPLLLNVVLEFPKPEFIQQNEINGIKMAKMKSNFHSSEAT